MLKMMQSKRMVILIKTVVFLVKHCVSISVLSKML